MKINSGAKYDAKSMNDNLKWWDERASMHAKSKFYNLPGIIAGVQRISDYEIDEIGGVRGKRLLHLQCHLGTETIDWARLGAEVSGLDFSREVIKQAEQLSEKCGVKIDYRVGNVYEAPLIFGDEKFDIVYVNIGSLHWLPDIYNWAKVVNEMLKDSGVLYVNEIHPFSSILGDQENNFMVVSYDYFNRMPIEWNDTGSYADTEPTKFDKHIIYDRPLSDIIMSIINANLRLELFKERPGQEYQQFEFQVQGKDGRWYNPSGMGVFPSTFSLKARKP